MKAKLFFEVLFSLCLLLSVGMTRTFGLTGDVIDDFLYYGIACGDEDEQAFGLNAVWADVDGDGEYDTQVVFTTLKGKAEVDTEIFGPDDYLYFFTYQDPLDTECEATIEDRGWLLIHFVDILAPGFVVDDPNTWTYKSIQTLSIKASHDEHVRPGSSHETAYQSIKAYRQHNQNGLIQGLEIELPGWKMYEFEDTEGIMELFITTDYSENNLNDLFLGEEYAPGLSLLFDVSGSMSWSHEGDPNVPVEQQRLTLAQNSSFPFVDMLYDHLDGTANFGITAFPKQPWEGCQGEVVLPMTDFDFSHYTSALSAIEGLSSSGNTPLLAGLEVAQEMFEAETHRAIVMLSDGYHNCPSQVNISDPEVVSLIQSLQEGNIRVYTIGFARPTDIDYPLLSGFANETGGMFWDVTGDPGFDPETWDPATALDGTYATILADGLGYEMPHNTLGVLLAGQEVSYSIGVNELDEKISFFLSWVTPQQERLGFVIRSSDGEILPELSTNGIVVHRGTTYSIMTVSQAFLDLPGKVSPTAWEIEIDGGNLNQGQRENYQISVIGQSDLRMLTSFDKSTYSTGETMTLTVGVIQNGIPLENLDSIKVELTTPLDGIGNWFVSNPVSYQRYKTTPANVSAERLSFIQRKANYLIEEMNIAFPGRSKPLSLPLYDDGTNGDRIPQDGFYTGRFSALEKEGNYVFNIQASGTTSEGKPFKRYLQTHKYVDVNISAEGSGLEIIPRDEIQGRFQRYEIKITPRDIFGNYLGPRSWKEISFEIPTGTLVRSVQDNLDGTYSQLVDLPMGIKPEEVNVQVNAGNAMWVTKMAGSPEKGPNISLWLSIISLVLVTVLFFKLQAMDKG